MVPHYFHTTEHELFGLIPDVSYYGDDQMNASERSEFLAWYEDQRSLDFDNKQVLEANS